MNKFGLSVTVIFITLIIIGNIFFPFGDEPDFEVRVDRLSGNHEVDKSIFWSGLAKNIQTEGLNTSYKNYYLKSDGGFLSHYENTDVNNCNIKGKSSDLWFDIPYGCIETNYKYILPRLGFTLFSILPILLFIVFRRSFYKYTRSYNSIDIGEWNNRLDAISLSIVFPGMVYFLGLISNEVLFMTTSLFIFLFWRRFLLLTIILFFLYILDNGNFLVVLSFVLLLTMFEQIKKYLGLKFLVVFSLFCIFSVYIIGDDVIFMLANIFPDSKFDSLSHELFSINAYEKYPLIFRPIITFMSFIFLTPHGVKSIFVYFIYSSILAVTISKIIQINRYHNKLKLTGLNQNLLLNVITVVTFLSCIAFTLPTHVYAKYYLFLMPFIIHPFLHYFNKPKIVALISLSSLLLFVNLAWYVV